MNTKNVEKKELVFLIISSNVLDIILKKKQLMSKNGMIDKPHRDSIQIFRAANFRLETDLVYSDNDLTVGF